jgi:putative ABC transport system substrate-binding protein
MSRPCPSPSRRRFLRSGLALAGVGFLSGRGLGVPWVSRPPGPRRIGYLSTNPSGPDPLREGFRRGLREHGWIEGQNITVEYRFAEGDLDRLPELGIDLVRSEVEVIHASSTPSALAARAASTAIPIVIATAGDPVGQGLAASLARPGGNVTGLTTISPGLTAKRVELLTEILPGLSRLGVSKNSSLSNSATYRGFLQGVEEAAQRYHLQLRWAEVSGPDPSELALALAELMREPPEALLVLSDPVTLNLAPATANLALHYRLPVMANSPDAARVRTGLLVGFGANQEDMYRRSAAYVDKILKGANPAELPIEQPTLLDFVLNLKTARALGLSIPPSVLQQATEIVQE